MAKKLRHYQSRLKTGIYSAWAQTHKAHAKPTTAVAVTATGSGKTVVMGNIAAELQSAGMRMEGLTTPANAHGVIIAHRKELVGQISSAMAAEGLRHNLLASQATVKAVVHKHMHDLKASYYDPRSNWTVASVDTLIARGYPCAERVAFAFTDEGHHVLAANKWGRGMQLFPNAFGLLMTATPCRADGQGLGEHSDGIAHALVEGPGLAELIRDGYLVNYRVLKTRPADLDTSDVNVTASGEWNQKEASRAVKRSRCIIGDAVRIYKEYTPGKRAILFAQDLEHGDALAAAFNAAGVPAMNVSGASDTARDDAIEAFKLGQLLVLINVDLFGEGFDVPACEVVIMCRMTKAFALYSQQIGRGLRLDITKLQQEMWDTFTVAQRLQLIAESPKPQATLIDLVGNVGTQYRIGDSEYVGLPEGFNDWTLDRRSRARAPSDGIPLRRCTNLTCGKDYERTEGCCPYCQSVAPPPAQRGTVQAVDGDVFELEGELLAQMRGNVLDALEGGDKVAPSWLENDPRTAGMAKIAAETKKHAVQTLMKHIDAWADAQGFDYAKCAKVFYYKFHMDVLTALSQPAGKCAELSARISKEY